MPAMTCRAALLQRIHRRYHTVVETVEIGCVRVEFTRIENPDRVLDEVALRDDSPNLPYWAELWDSAMGVGEYLTTHYSLPATHRAMEVLDLGCGMGLAGTVAAAMGHRVLFADLEPPALLFARLNSLPFGQRVRVRRIDWGKDRLAARFRLIIGSDILYEKAQWPMLEAFWRAHLDEAGTVLLGEPGRQTGELFPAWLGQRGWRLDEDAVKVATREKPIRIFSCRRL